MKDFWMFVRVSWHETRHQRLLFLVGFIPAWLSYLKARRKNDSRK